MCLVACGSADAYYHMGIHCWDMAGGAAVVTEAGGVIMDISGESRRKQELWGDSNCRTAEGDFFTEQSETGLLLFERKQKLLMFMNYLLLLMLIVIVFYPSFCSQRPVRNSQR